MKNLGLLNGLAIQAITNLAHSRNVALGGGLITLLCNAKQALTAFGIFTKPNDAQGISPRLVFGAPAWIA